MLCQREPLRWILLADEICEALDQWRDARQDADMLPGAFLADDSDRKKLQFDDIEVLERHLTLLARDDCAGGTEAVSARFWDEGCEVCGMGDSIVVGTSRRLPGDLPDGL